MLGSAARAMGYRVAILDPDPDCPAAAVADHVVIGSYDDVGAALRLADLSDVVTYELEHIAAEVVATLARHVPVRPGHRPLLVTQDRLAERRFIEDAGIAVAPWRAVRTADEARAATDELGLPMRLKLPVGGYDGRGQLRIRSAAELSDAWARLARTEGDALLAERELDFEAELSVVVARGTDGTAAAYPIARNRHDAGILAESVAPAPIAPEVAACATTIGTTLAARDGPARHPDRGAVPAPRRLAGRQRARTAGPQLRPLDDRGRPRPRSSSSTSVPSADWGWARPPRTARPRWSTCSGPAPGARPGSTAWRPPSPTRPSTSTCTASGPSSNVARWAT